MNGKACRNLNHGKSNPAVAFCVECGARFNGGSARSCDKQKHVERRKNRCLFCFDCGKDLSKIPA